MNMQLEKIFKRYNVILAYRFGSSVKGTENSLSDVDIAVLFDKEIDDVGIFLELSHKLSEIFKNENLDLTILNDASPILRHAVATEGKLLFEKKEDLDKEFSARALREYEDTKHLADVYFEAMKHRIGYHE